MNKSKEGRDTIDKDDIANADLPVEPQAVPKRTWDETARAAGVITMVQEGRDVTLNESESEEQEQERKIFSRKIVGK